MSSNLGITVAIFCGLIVICAYIWNSERFREYSILNLAPLIRYGLEAQCRGAFVKADDPGKVPNQWFHARTLILGHDKERGSGAAAATFTFLVPRNLLKRKSDVSAYLVVEAERIHGGLHSSAGPKEKKAEIEVNGRVVDRFWLIDKMPNGEHYGYRNVGPVPIDDIVLRAGILHVTLSIEDQMAWDIDRVTVQISRGERRLTVHGSMWVGALASAACGLSPAVIEAVFGK